MIRPFVFLLFITVSFNQVRNEEIIDIVSEVDNSSIISNDLLMSVEEFFKCIAQAEPIANDIYDMIKAIKAKDYKSMISFIYKSIADGHSMYSECIKGLPELEALIKKYIKINFDDLNKCIVDTHLIVEDITDLISVIVKKDYDEAVAIVYKTLLEGGSVVKECINVFK